MDNKEYNFQYNYSAKQQDDIRWIREKYLPKKESKLEQIYDMDARASKPGIVAGLVVGIISTLLLGVGMCCTMLWADRWFIPGIVVGIIGMAGMGVAYPLYNRITKNRREKIAPEIIRLTDEIMEE